MKLDPDTLLTKTFSRKNFGGYSKTEVVDFLKSMAEELKEHLKQKQDFSEKLMETEAFVREYRDREEMLKSTITTAQQMSNKIKIDAEKEAQFILADAKQKAEIIVKDAKNSLKKSYQDLSDLKRLHIQLKNTLKSVLQSHQDLLDQGHYPTTFTASQKTENSEETLIERKVAETLNQAVQAKDYL